MILVDNDLHFQGLNVVNVAIEVSSKGLRPPVPDCGERMSKLMTQCWESLPEDRPDFQTICYYINNTAVPSNSQQLAMGERSSTTLAEARLARKLSDFDDPTLITNYAEIASKLIEEEHVPERKMSTDYQDFSPELDQHP